MSEIIEETSWEDAMWAENNFQHLDLSEQAKEARKLKFQVQWCHKRIKKTTTRLYEIFNPQHAKPHR